MHTLSRLVILLAVLALAACGSDDGNTSKSTTTAPSSAVNTAASPASTGAAQPAQPKGELKIASSAVNSPRTLDVAKDGYSLIYIGAAETLTRLNREQKVEPWLAEKVEQRDATTWRATLRKNARFHDGTSVTAEEVVASFKRSWEQQPAAARFIPKETAISAVDATTVEFKLTQAAGAFANNLAGFQFAIAKPGPNNVSIMTGPYKPVRLDTDQQIVVDAFAEHWAGPPPIAKITIRLIPDVNARALALQAGEVDMALALPPETANGLPGSFEKAIVASTRIDHALLNLSRAPFSERAVREAFALGTPRDLLNKGSLDGLGVVVTSIFPEKQGVDILPIQTTDIAKANQTLDAAGWRMGADGVRVKDGKRLAIKLLSYPGRGELGPMGTILQQELKKLGFEVSYELIPSEKIVDVLAAGDWDASLYSVNMLPTGDPLYAFNVTLIPGAANNYQKYDSSKLNAILDQMRGESDNAKRQTLAKQAQEVLKDDVPNAYILALPLIYTYNKAKVQGFVPHPNDLYFINREMSVR